MRIVELDWAAAAADMRPRARALANAVAQFVAQATPNETHQVPVATNKIRVDVESRIAFVGAGAVILVRFESLEAKLKSLRQRSDRAT
jgi:hypothetical protein